MTSPLEPQRLDRRTVLHVLALGLLAGCDSLDNFDVPIDAQAKIPAGTVLDELLGSLSFGQLESIDLTQELKNQGVTKDDVDAVRVQSFSLSITAPPGQTFDFLEAISFSVETAGQPKVLVASLDPIPQGVTKIELRADTKLDLVPYVVAPSMKMTASVTGKRPAQETTVTANIVLDVDVNVA